MSILQKQIVQILLKGLNQKNPDSIGVPGGLEIAQNVRIDRGQEAGFEFVRRNGIVEVADLATLALVTNYSSYRLGSTQAGLIVVDGFWGVERYSPTAGTFMKMGVNGGIGAIGVSRSDLQAPVKAVAGSQTPSQSGLDAVYIGNLGLSSWYDQDGIVQVALRDASGFAIGRYALNGSGATNTKVVAVNAAWLVFWKEANAIKCSRILATAGALGMSSSTVNGAFTAVAAGSALAGTDYDIQGGFDSTKIALLYRSAAGTYVRALFDSTTIAVTSSSSDATAANQPDVALCWLSQPSFAGSLYYATLNAANGLKIQTIDASTLAITATITQAGAPVTNVKNMAGGSRYGSASGNHSFVLIDRQITDGSGVNHRVIDKVDANSGVFPFWSNCSLVSRVAFLGPASLSVGYVALLYNSSQAAGSPVAQQPTMFLMNVGNFTGLDLTPPTIVAKAMPGAAGAHTTFSLTSLSADSSGVTHGLFAHAVKVDTKSGEVVLQYQLADVGFSYQPATIGAPLKFGGVTLIPGGEVYEIDSSPFDPLDGSTALHEQGFRVKPEIPKVVEGAAASGSMIAGARSYVVRWKWVDSSSQEYRSATSTPVPITTVNANSSVQASIYGPDAAAGRQFVQAEILCTPVGGTGDIYYRVTPSVYTVDTATRAVLTFLDQHSEATLLAGEPWEPVTELENVAPPALNDIVEHKNRVFGIDAEQPWRIRFSKEYTPGTSFGFTDSFIVETPDSTGPLYKLMSMDGHLIGFKRDTIYVWAGDFPDNTGAGAIPSATLLPVGVGTEQPRSAVLTDLGIVFYSSKRGFWLLTRSLGVEYIGAPIEATASGQTVSGATVHPTYPEVRFTTEGGTTFVLNTHFTRVAGAPMWTTFTAQACVHSIVHGGDWYLLTSAGKLLKEDLTRWQDGSTVSGSFVAGTAYTAKVKISDLNFAGIGGLGRVWRGQLLGQWYDSYKVKVSLSLNHRSVAGQVFNFDATADPDPYQLEFRLNAYESKQTSMDITIEDTTDFQTRAFAWDALIFVIGVKPGLFRRGKNFAMVGT